VCVSVENGCVVAINVTYSVLLFAVIVRNIQTVEYVSDRTARRVSNIFAFSVLTLLIWHQGRASDL